MSDLAYKQEIIRLRNLVEYYRLDELTGLKMRKDFENDINILYMNKASFYLIIIDINQLHNVNFEDGYIAGDKLIVESVKEIIDCNPTGDNDMLYRIGGDEFAILFEFSKGYHSGDLHCDSDRFTVATKCSADYDTKDKLFSATDTLLRERKALYYLDKQDRRR